MPDDQDLLFDEPLESHPPERQPAAASPPPESPPPTPDDDHDDDPTAPTDSTPPPTAETPAMPAEPTDTADSTDDPQKTLTPLPADLKFEDALDQLEEIVDQMESGDLALDQCLEKFERGMQLSTFCMKRLKATERKVEILTKSANGDNWDSFEPDTDDDDDDDI